MQLCVCDIAQRRKFFLFLSRRAQVETSLIKMAKDFSITPEMTKKCEQLRHILQAAK